MSDTEKSLQIQDLVSLSYANDFTKKSAKETGERLAKIIIDEGEVNVLEALGNIVRMKEVLLNAEAAFKKSDVLLDKAAEGQSFNGVKFSVMNTGDRLDYEKDPIYEDLNRKLKARKDLLSQAHKHFIKTGNRIYTDGYDSETGEELSYEVPVVPVKTVGKQAIKIEY
jgi:hypothetical protein